MSRSQSLGGFLHGAANALVGGAAAEIAAHRRVDVRIGRFAILGQEADRRHDLPGLAIAALRHVELDPGVLNRLRDFAADALDRRYGLAGGIRDRRLARAHGLAVQIDRAGAARRDAAAPVLRAREVEEIPESPEERYVRLGIDGVRRAVDRQIHHEAAPWLAMSPPPVAGGAPSSSRAAPQRSGCLVSGRALWSCRASYGRAPATRCG